VYDAAALNRIDPANMPPAGLSAVGDDGEGSLGSKSASSVTNQVTLNDMTSKFGGRTPVRVHFMDNSSKMFLLDDTVLVRDVVVMVIEKLGISDGNPLAVAPYFSIYECPDGSTIGNALAPESVLVDTVQSWSTVTFKLLFMIRLYMPTLWGIEFRDSVAQRLDKPISMLSDEVYLEAADVSDEELLRVQYIQAVYNVITGQYHTTEAEILKMTAFQFFYKFGAYKPTVHKTGFLGERIVEFIPLRHLKEQGSEEWERKLFKYIQDKAQYEYQFESQRNAQRKFMDEVFRLDTYGCTFFKATTAGLIVEGGSQDKSKAPVKVVLGVSYRGLDIFDKGVSRTLIANFSFGELLSWAYDNDGKVFIKLPNVDPFENKPYAMLRKGSVEFSMSHADAVSADAEGTDCTRMANMGKVACDLLTDYALAFARECQFEGARTGAASRLSGDEIGARVDVGPDVIPGMSDHAPEEASTITSAPKGAVFSPKAELERARMEAQRAQEEVRMNPIVAAVIIQKMFRGYFLRVTWVREGCAELIQNVWRGYHARLLVSDMISQMMLE